MDNRHYVAKNKPKTFIRLTILIVLVLAFVGLIVGGVLLFRSCSLAASKRSLPFAYSAENAYTGDGFMYMEGSTLKYINLKDESKNYSISVNAPTARLMGTSGIKIVYNSRALQMIGTQYDIELEGEVVKLCCGSKYAAVYRLGNDGSKTLHVYDSAGSECYQIDFTDAVLTDFGFESSTSPILWTSELITTGNCITTTVTIYDLSRSSITGVISVQGQLVKDIFITSNSIFAVCTDNIIRYDRRSNIEAYRLLTYGYDCTSCSFSGGRALFVLKREEGDTDSVRLLSVSEKDVANESSSLLVLQTGVVNSFAMNGNFIVVSQEKLLIYDASGKLTKEAQFDQLITSAEKLDERNILIGRGDEALLYTIN